MAELIVLPPILNFDSIVPGVAIWEQPVEFSCQAPVFPDDRPFKLEHLGQAGLFQYRRKRAGADPEIWDERANKWRAESGTRFDNLEPLPLYYEEGESMPWRGILVAAGQRDKNNNHKFELQSRGLVFPQYFFRAYFEGVYGGKRFSGLSEPTPPIRFVNFFGRNRVGLMSGKDVVPDPLSADEILLFVRDVSRSRVVGQVRIKDVGGQGKIEIINKTNSGTQISKIEMNAEGDIVIDCERDLIVNCKRKFVVTAPGGAILPSHSHSS